MKRPGFSLLELLMYIAISALLMQLLFSWLVPTMRNVKASACTTQRSMNAWHAVDCAKKLLEDAYKNNVCIATRNAHQIAWTAQNGKRSGLSIEKDALYILQGKRKSLLTRLNSDTSYFVYEDAPSGRLVRLFLDDASMSYQAVCRIHS